MEWAVFDKNDLKKFLANTDGNDFKCEDIDGNWHRAGWTSCHRCLEENCEAKTEEGCIGTEHPQAFKHGKNKPKFQDHFQSAIRAMGTSGKYSDVPANYRRILTDRHHPNHISRLKKQQYC